MLLRVYYIHEYLCLVNSAQEVKELIEIAIKNDCLLVEGMWSRLLPTYKQAKNWIEEGRIGEILNIRVEKSKRKNYFDQDKRKRVIWDYGIYPLSFVQFFFKHIEISNSSVNFIEGLDSDWHITMTNGKQFASIDISGRYDGDSKAYIVGSHGMIVFDRNFNSTSTVSLYNISGELIDKKIFKYISEGFEYEIQAVNDAIKKGSKEIESLSLKDTCKVIGLMEQLTAEVPNV